MNAPSSLEDWFTRPRLFVLLAIFIFIAFPGIILGSESLFYRDMGLFGYPLAHFYREAFWRGEIPLWNPLSNCGIPFLAQWNTLVLYPGSLIYLLLPLPWSMNLFVFVHVFLAAAGMYTLAWRWTGNRFAGAIAGLLFAWNGFTLHALMWPAVIAAVGWMPWVLLQLEEAWNEGGRRRIAMGALIASMQMLTGAPEVILLTWIIAAVFCVRDMISSRQTGSMRRRGQLLARIVFCGVLVMLVCAAQLLPFAELLQNSQRNAAFGGDVWSMPLWGWANFFVPLFGCTPSVIGVYTQDAQQWISSYYMGAATLVLAPLAWRSGDSRVKWLTGLAVAGVAFALGNNGIIYSALKQVFPLLGTIRFPIKYIVLTIFVLPLLAAFGIAWWTRVAATEGSARRWFIVTLAIISGLIVGIIGWAWWRPLPGTVPSVAAWNGLWRVVLLLSIAYALHFVLHGGRVGLIARAAVLCLLATDVLTHVPRQNPTVPISAYGGLPPEMSSMPKLGEGRAMISPPMQRLFEGAAVADPFTLYRGQRRTLLYNCNLLDAVPKVNGFFPLYVRDEEEISRQLYRSTNYASLPLLDFLGISQLSAASEMFRWDAYKTPMPMVSAGQAPSFVPSSESLAGIFSEKFTPRETVYLPAHARGQVSVASNACRVLSFEVRAQRLVTFVEASAPSLVVFAQTDYPVWRAFVNGSATRIWRANHAYQAVLVPAGQHRIELRYRDRAFQMGCWISLVAFTGCAGALGFELFQRRRKS